MGKKAAGLRPSKKGGGITLARALYLSEFASLIRHAGTLQTIYNRRHSTPRDAVTQ